MREIKFRAWWENVKEMRYLDNPEIVFDGSRWGMFWPSVQKNVFLGKAEVMQFTGLHDKNGKEIYEGDIVQDIQAHNGKIVYGGYWNEAGFGKETNYPIPPNKAAVTWDRLTHEMAIFLEIIGNIHETPELLPDTGEPK